MLKALDQALRYDQHNHRPKMMRRSSSPASLAGSSTTSTNSGLRRPPSVPRRRLGWMVPLLAVMSFMMNGSLQVRRLHRVSLKQKVAAAKMERGPTATTKPVEDDHNSPFGYIAGEISRQILTQSDYPASEFTLGFNNNHTNDKVETESATAPEAGSSSSSNIETSTIIYPTQKRMEKNGKKSMAVNSEALDRDVGFSACLLIKDDNDILNEWIAYHYYTLNMKRLVVAVDPGSETSPALLLKVWNSTTDMKIDIWNDMQYMPQAFLESGKPPAEDIKQIDKFKDVTPEEMLGINIHRYRQRVFVTECFRKIKEEKRTWALHIDTDEYVVPNQLLRKGGGDYVSIPSSREPGSIVKLVQDLVKSHPSNVKYPCITMIRLLFGSVETKEADWPLSLPSGFQRNQFETLRWRHHGPFEDKKMHGYPKVLVDVSKIPRKLLSKDPVYSIHRPFQQYCRGMGDIEYQAYQKFPITTNHYLGSWERYNSRGDTRRSWDVYNQKANLTSGQDTWVDGWFQGFIESVGEEKAARLLGQHYLNQTETVTTGEGMLATSQKKTM